MNIPPFFANKGYTHQTDGSCETEQYRKTIKEGQVYSFIERRCIDPARKEYEFFEAEIDLKDYSREEIIGYLSPYGYDIDEISGDKELIAECIFELTTD